MAVTYRWVVEQMDAYPKLENHKDVVFNIHWRVFASDGTNETNTYGANAIVVDPDKVTTPYEDLTEKQVLGWLKDAIGEEGVIALEDRLAEKLEEIKNPPVVRPSLPWSE